MTVTALLDTGSTVSTVSRSFYDQHLSDRPIIPLDTIITIECADGQPLPYDGVVKMDIDSFGSEGEVDCLEGCIFLVIPDSPYNRSVPLLVGTNILSIFMNRAQTRHGVRFLQVAKLLTPIFLAFRCMLMRDRELEKRHHKLAVIKSAEQSRITIMPNTEVVIQGYTDHEVPYQPVCALIHPTENSSLSDDLDVTPTIIPYQYQRNGVIQVHVTNVSSRIVTVQPGALLCEIQPVSIEDVTSHQDEDASQNFLSQIDICQEELTESEIQRGIELIKVYH
jgi:hypothetical protein